MVYRIDHRGCLSFRIKDAAAGDAVGRAGRQLWQQGERLDGRSGGNRCAIQLVRRGVGRFSIGDEHWGLAKGDCILRATGHVFCVAAEGLLELQMVSFVGRELTAMVQTICGSQAIVWRPRRVGGIQAGLESIHRHLLADGPHAQAIALHHLRGLLLELQADRERQAVAGTAEQRYWDFRAFARQQFRSLSTVEDWATACACTPTYLARLFARYDVCTPLQFLQQQKVLEAENLLEEGRLSIADVGEAVGFTDPFRFSKVFKRCTGLSPRAFRHQLGQR